MSNEQHDPRASGSKGKRILLEQRGGIDATHHEGLRPHHITTDDGLLDVDLIDLPAWFTLVGTEDLLALIQAGFRPADATDTIAGFMENQDRCIADLFRYLEIIN